MPSMFILKDGSTAGAPPPALAFGRNQMPESGPFEFLGKQGTQNTAKPAVRTSPERKLSESPKNHQFGFAPTKKSAWPMHDIDLGVPVMT